VLNAHATLASYTMRTDIWDSHSAALRRLGTRARISDVLLDTFQRGSVAPKLAMLPDLDTAVAGLADSDDFRHIVVVASAASQLDQMAACRPALERVVGRHRGDGTNVLVGLALHLLGSQAQICGDWARADRLIGEGRARGSTDTQPGWLLDVVAGVLAARRGRSTEVARVRAVLADRSLRPTGRLLQVMQDVIRAEDAIGRAEWSRGVALLRGLMPADDPFVEFNLVPFLTLNFAEAAWHAGRPGEARAHVAVMREAGCAQLSSRAALITAGAEGVVAADDGEAAVLFERALADPDAARWPWERARVQLAHGRRLRRGRDPRAARAPLSAALETFERLGAAPWVEQANVELKATGHGVVRQGPESSALTAQELTIADLAATGLTNKQIGEKLALSPRTVSTHLYRIFPKLGVTTRAGLRDAIDRSATS
jgi:DNA-binding CsgD family transcriptional regulator